MENIIGVRTEGFTAHDRSIKNQASLYCAVWLISGESSVIRGVNDEQRASYALSETPKLYDIERLCKDQSLSIEQIKKVRQQQSVPVRMVRCKWMKVQYSTVVIQP